MVSKYLILCLFIVLVCACKKEYEYIEPGSSATIEINFKDDNGKPKSTICSYSVPASYTEKKEWPIILTLHGDGSNAMAFHDLWHDAAASAGFVAITPQGENRTRLGFGWSWGENSERIIRICVEIVRKKININPERIYLAGFSSGGSLTYKMALKYPSVFRGIAALGAPFSADFYNDSLTLKNNSSFQNMKVYIGHGTLEKNYKSDPQLAAKVFKEKGAHVMFTPYKDIGHSIPEPKKEELAHILNFFSEDNN
jgi:phospholipase/carboxylesterase